MHNVFIYNIYDRKNRVYCRFKGALRARRRFATITGSNFCKKFHPLLASSQHIGATAAVIIFG